MASIAMADQMSDADFEALAQSAREATSLLKALAHEGRLMILCYLTTGEKSVS